MTDSNAGITNDVNEEMKKSKSRGSGSSKNKKRSIDVTESLSNICEGGQAVVGLVDTSSASVLGSPFLDVTLGQVDAVLRVMQVLSFFVNPGLLSKFNPKL